jgi:hypothetical protein
MFNQRQQNGWKVQTNEHLNELECDKLLKLYIDVYGHAPTNGDYLAIFLYG